MLRIKRRFLDRLIREPMDNEEEEFFDDNDSDVLDNEIGSRHNFQRWKIEKQTSTTCPFKKPVTGYFSCLEKPQIIFNPVR